MLCNRAAVITSITWCITCSLIHYMLNYMLNYMLKSYYMLHYMPTTCSITCSITCHYMQHNHITCSITCQLHAQLHDSLHTQLPNITWIAWHEPKITCFLCCLPQSRIPPSLSAGCGQDSHRPLRRLMRGLLERILSSCPEHENTGLESVRIIKSPHLFLWSTSDRLNPDHLIQEKEKWTGCIQTIEKEKWTGKIESSHQHDWVGESNPPQNSKWVGESNRH